MSGILLCSECFTAHAVEYDTYYIPPETYLAYQYWFDYGFNSIYDINLTETATFSMVETVSETTQHATGYGQTSGCLYVPPGSQNNTAYNLTTGCGAGTGNVTTTISEGTETTTGQNVASIGSTQKIWYNYKLPWLSASSITHDTSYNSSRRFEMPNGTGTHFYISLYTSKNLWSTSAQYQNNINIYLDPNYDGEIKVSKTYSVYYGGFYYWIFDIESVKVNNQRITFSFDFPAIDANTQIIPGYMGVGNGLTDDQKSSFGIVTNLENTIYSSSEDIQQTFADQSLLTREEIDKIYERQARIWWQQNDTTGISDLQNTSDGLISSGNEKFRNLLYPIQWVADEALSLANAPSTGQVTLPAIFSDDYWILDLTSIENNLPDAWAFIQNMCRLAVAVYLIYGLINTFRGGVNDS